MLIATSVLGQVKDSVEVDSAKVASPNVIINPSALSTFYAKLKQVHSVTPQKLNIVHIGDSHIQADLMTNVARQNLQKIFGNGGRGFIFPYSVAKTNGASDIRFSSIGSFQSLRNISPPSELTVGLSGIALQNKSSDFEIELLVKDPVYHFNTIKVISPSSFQTFAFANEKIKTISETSVPKSIVHRIKSGEALSLIASKYGISVSEIKRANNLKSNAIRAGKTLKIPSAETQKRTTETFKYIPLEAQKTDNYAFYHFEIPQSTLALIPVENATFNLNGIVLENDNNGIIYHNIGVNGSKFSDYNKYPLFFQQLAILSPDLVILSLGTNESFDKLIADDYMKQLMQFVSNLRMRNPEVSILISTPPPSLFSRKYANNFVEEYSKEIVNLANDNSFAVWDLYSLLGGNSGISENAKNNLIGPDRVHYTKLGYELQGKLLSEAILNGSYLK